LGFKISSLPALSKISAPAEAGMRGVRKDDSARVRLDMP
jgi:hypothetical protein